VLRFTLPSGAALGADGRVAPTGIKVLLPGTDLSKSYSPVSHPAAKGFFDLLVKAYPPREGGGLGHYLCSMQPGDEARMWVKAKHYGDIGGAPVSTNRWSEIGMIANGTGVAPLIQIAVQVLNEEEDTTRVSLIFQNRTEDDILMRKELQDLVRRHPQRFSVHHILTQPSATWNGGCGRLNATTLRHHLPAPSPKSIVFVCGTDGFRESVAGDIQKVKTSTGKKKKLQGALGGYLAELGYTSCMVHKF